MLTFRRFAAFSIGLVLSASLALPSAAIAQKDSRAVRVGWFGSIYCQKDPLGNRKGIAYEYLQKIAAYNGWTYEYVEGSWPNLFRMLENGEIDVLGVVSYSAERTGRILYPAFPMGTESYFLFADAKNSRGDARDHTALEGRRIGVDKGSVQEGFLREWAAKNGISPVIVPLTLPAKEGLAMLSRGELDAYAMVDNYKAGRNFVPIARLGSSEFFFAVSKKRHDLLEELNSSLVSIIDEDAHYNQKLYAKHNGLSMTNTFLLPRVERWLGTHGAIRVGYQQDSLPFCALDEKTQKLTGALKDYLLLGSNAIRNTRIQFDPRPYASTAEAFEALKRGEINCVFPVNQSLNEGERTGVMVANGIMQTQMFLLMRPDRHDSVLDARHPATVAVRTGNDNYTTFVREHFPAWRIVPCTTPEQCIRKVAAGQADSYLVGSYRLNEIEALRNQHNLILVPTGMAMPISFAMKRTSPELYSILNKITNMTSAETVNAYLSHYANPHVKLPFMLVLKQHWQAVLFIVVGFFVIVLALLLQKLRAERKVHEQKQQLVSVQKMALTDPATGVKSRHAFENDSGRLNAQIAQGSCRPFAVGVFDLNNLKEVNDTLGHEAGDEYIRQGCLAVCHCFKRSPVYRIGGDEFAVIASGEDYEARDELLAGFHSLMMQNQRDGKVIVAGGVSAFDPEFDKSFNAVFERADVAMYANKKTLKQHKNS